MKNIVITIFALFIFNDGLAQYNNLITAGDKAFKNKDYYAAAFFYNKAVTDSLGNNKIPFYSAPKTIRGRKHEVYISNCYRLAESYRLYQNYNAAEEWYAKVATPDNEMKYPLARLWYGLCLKANEHFDEAIKQLQQFAAAFKGDRQFKDMAAREIAGCIFARQQYATKATVEVVKMDMPWNAAAGNYAIAKGGKNYYFTSSRPNEGSKKQVNRIYTLDTKDPSRSVLVDLKYADNKKDAEYGTPSLNANGDRLYLTRWYKEGPKTVLSVFFSERSNGRWTTLRKLNSNVNANGFNALQPFVTADGKQLFFASDKPGGLGGYDIWVSSLDGNGDALNSLNLGKIINTPLNEEAPFFDDAGHRLFYSSNGLVGLGGFDIFESNTANGKWSTPQNMGYPTNSTVDDLYYFAGAGDENKFYISSARGSDCCLSLYQLQKKHHLVAGYVVDCETHTPLTGVKVSLVDTILNKTVSQAGTNEKAMYVFDNYTDGPFKLKLEKEGYFKNTVRLLVNGQKDTLFNTVVCMSAFKINKPIVIKNILYDYNKADLRPVSKIALDSIVRVMIDNPGIKIEIGSHTDAIGSAVYNLKLSQQRAQSCVDYMISRGIDSMRLQAKGYGEGMPIAPNSLPDGSDNVQGRQLNRRTEFTVKER